MTHENDIDTDRRRKLETPQEAETLGLRERIQVHRLIEWLAAHRDVIEGDRLEAAKRAGLVIPEDGWGRRLLDEELVKLGHRLRAVQAAEEIARSVNDQDEEQQGLFDPYGEIAGGRLGDCRLICRQVARPRRGQAGDPSRDRLDELERLRRPLREAAPSGRGGCAPGSARGVALLGLRPRWCLLMV